MTRVADHDRPRTLAFYLPQFHAIPENDAWWGEGFTEWTNVRKAEPLFAGHHQPRAPAPELGYYDLADGAMLHEQARTAAQADVDAFCFYFYWFDGVRLLERPLESYLDSGPDFPFCLCWANENWTRRWDGKHKDVLMPQSYHAEYEAELFGALLPYLADPRYVRTADGRPVLLVHRADDVPDARRLADRLRELAAGAGLDGLHLVAAETRADLDPRDFGFDASAEFPPVGSNTLASALLTPVSALSPRFRGRLLSYDRLVRRFVRRRSAAWVRYRGVAPGWDNTPRRSQHATVYVGSSPAAYRGWLRAAREAEAKDRNTDGMVFINAWNEWAEGAYLEPDELHGDAYLRATRWDSVEQLPSAASRRRGLPSPGQGRSLALLVGGSALSLWRATLRRPLRWSARGSR